jgi:hypothetical protein
MKILLILNHGFCVIIKDLNPIQMRILTKVVKNRENFHSEDFESLFVSCKFEWTSPISSKAKNVDRVYYVIPEFQYFGMYKRKNGE